MQKMPSVKRPDNDIRKGASEQESGAPGQADGHNLNSQLGHRDEDEMLKDADSDFPEPGSSPEHSGQRQTKFIAA
jgi:hypothetical protein